MSAKLEYITNMRREEATLDESIQGMKAELAKAEGADRVRLLETLEEARTHKEALAQKLSAAEASGDDAWGELKAGLESTWKSLVTTVTSVSAKVEEAVAEKREEARASQVPAAPAAHDKSSASGAQSSAAPKT